MCLLNLVFVLVFTILFSSTNDVWIADFTQQKSYIFWECWGEDWAIVFIAALEPGS